MNADIFGAGFTGWAVEALIASTILMAFVLLARKEAQRALGPQLAYWLWALPALRMAMPPLPASWRESAAAPLSAASETVLVMVQPILPAAATADVQPFPWIALVAGAWVLGALAFFVWHSLAHASYVRRIVSPPARHARLPDGTTLVESEEAVGPVAFGIFKRFVAVPTDFAERYDADERKLALAHELGHHARGDLIANWVGLAVLACHWFNPIAWIAYRKFRADQEMANDARVLSALPPIERHAYACAIVKAAHGRAVTAACHLHTIEDLKGRLRMLKASRKSRRVIMAGAVGIASLTVAGLGLTASGAAAEKIRTVAETQVVAMVQAAPVTEPNPPAVTAAPSAPDGSHSREVVIVRDGRTEVYEGAAADAIIVDRDGRRTSRHRIVVRENGKTTVYEGAEADAYARAHPTLPLAAPVAPAAPLASSWSAPRVPPVQSVATVTDRDGKVIVSAARGGTRVVQTGPDRFAVATANVRVVSGDCGPGNPREFVRKDDKNGVARMVICDGRIERFVAEQAKFAEAHAKASKRMALSSLIASRGSIAATRGLTDAQRAEALAGIDEARAELEAEIHGSADD